MLSQICLGVGRKKSDEQDLILISEFRRASWADVSTIRQIRTRDHSTREIQRPRPKVHDGRTLVLEQGNATYCMVHSTSTNQDGQTRRSSAHAVGMVFAICVCRLALPEEETTRRIPATISAFQIVSVATGQLKGCRDNATATPFKNWPKTESRWKQKEIQKTGTGRVSNNVNDDSDVSDQDSVKSHNILAT